MARNQQQQRSFIILTIIFFLLTFNYVASEMQPVEDVEIDNKEVPTDLEEKKAEELDVLHTTSAPLNPNLGFLHAFFASFSVIIVSEIGDKTFFIAAILSMKNPRIIVFLGAIVALALMTVLSAVFGMVFIQFIPQHIVHYVSIFLFVVFGLKMLHEGYTMSNNSSEEIEEVQSEIRKKEDEVNKDTNKSITSADPEAGVSRKAKASAATVLFRIFMQSFTMTFVAEWGDRSQLTTIILSARENLSGVILGGVIGHSICTGIGVIGGRFIAQKISVKTVTLIGGVVFLLFAITSLFYKPGE
ncbi:unnamed protein product [Diamesa serratosioi]